MGFPGPACQCWRHKRHEFNPWVRKNPWRWAQQPPPVFLLEESPWTEEPGRLQPWGHKESDTTKATQHQQQQQYDKRHIYIYVCVCVYIYIYEHPDEAIHKLISDRVSSSGNSVPLDTRKLSEFYTLGIFMETSSCRHDQSLTPLSALLPSQENGGVELKTSSLHHGLVFLGASPHPGSIQGLTQRHIM